MCGIAGLIEFSRRRDRQTLEAAVARMAATLRHRGPDDAGAWADPEAGVALGHRRLSILDLSPLGHQPMHSACGRYTLTFNGEIYNFRALRAELEAAGHTFRGHSDTEIMLAAFSQWGPQGALARFNGMFAFGLWDHAERTLWLARDRLGEKPLYYGLAGRTFLFGSELKALRAHSDFRAPVSRAAVALLLRYNYVPAPYSIYEGICKLEPGRLLAVRACEPPSLRPVAYWSAREVAERGAAEPFAGSAEEAVSELEALLRDAVRLRLEADVPLGAFLSGGVDSSTVVALMQAESPRPVRTFTIGFHEAAYNEAEDARAVARHLGTEHTEIYVSPQEALAVIPDLAALCDEPFADSSLIPTFLVSRLTRRHVTVSLSGDGGDELFAGYIRHFWCQDLWRRVGWLPRGMRAAAARMITALSPTAWDGLMGCLEPCLPPRLRQRSPGDKLHKLATVLPVADPEAMYLALVSQWPQPAALVPGAAEPPTTAARRGEWAELPDLAQTMMYLDMVTYLPDDILVKVDRASMGVSLEARVPLLDHRVVEFAWRLPLCLKLRRGVSKWLLRQVLYRHVPPGLVERPKMGFRLPVAAWLRGALREWAESLLEEGKLRQAGLEPGPIRGLWAEHLSGRWNWEYRLWGVLMLQAWLEMLSSPACN